ncbi:hypothetical protein [Planctomyces sp. SH-PL62]|uniref:hypothetical protein n=1 Tax=Planctomyces sp. SH-PL62 TaxID=1636152 RepID=UPI00078B8E93|nr:hypothetical protein [Planctomyces sp. SH-PL62]AMV36104.1 hypothetical protein VT85_01580 [Planctomyces sp. SH-PL62]
MPAIPTTNENMKVIKRVRVAVAAALIAALGPGCWSEDRLAGTPTNLPPGTMPPAPPLEQSPVDLAKTAKVKGRSKARP